MHCLVLGCASFVFGVTSFLCLVLLLFCTSLFRVFVLSRHCDVVLRGNFLMWCIFSYKLVHCGAVLLFDCFIEVFFFYYMT